jgi:hypothetical protein
VIQRQLVSDADIHADNMWPRSGAKTKEKTAVMNNDMALVELSETELDVVGAGAQSLVNLSHLVSINLPINIGIGLQGQANISIFSLATQGGQQQLILGLFNNA